MTTPQDVNTEISLNNALRTTSNADSSASEMIAIILTQVQAHTGRDFSHYQSQLATATAYALDFWQAIADLLTEVAPHRARDAQLQFQADVLQQISEAVIAIDQDERITYLNAAAAAQYEADPTAAIGQPLRYLHQYEWLKPEDEVIAYAMLAEQNCWRGENRHIKRNGKVLHVESTVSPLRNPAGQEIGLLACIRDITTRKQAEAALQASEARYRQLADAMPQLVWTANAAGVVDYYNIRIHDYDAAVWQGSYGFDWERLLHPDDLAPTLAAWQKAVTRKESYSVEHRLHMADGSWRWHLSRAVPVHGSLPEIRWYGTATDIHEQKQVEAELRQSEARYLHLFETMDEGFCVFEMLFDETEQPLDYRFLEVNPAFATFTGLVDAAGKTARELVPNLEAHWFDIYGQVALTGEPRRFVEGSAAMGRWFDVYAFRFGVPEEHRVALLFTDITARKAAEDAMRASEAFSRAILDSSPDCIKVLDPDGRLLQMNPRGLCLMELDDFTPLVGQNWEQLWPADCSHLIRAALTAARAGGQGRFQGFCPTAKGTPKWWDVIVAPVQDGLATTTHFIAVSRDITEAKRTEETLREREARLNTILQNIPAAVYMVSTEQHYLYVNQHYEQLASITNAEIQGKSIDEMFTPETAAILKANDRRVLTTQQTITFEEAVAIHGEIHTYASTKIPLLHGNGEPYALLGISTDITDRKQAERNQQFLLDLDAHTRLLADEHIILTTTTERLGQHLGVAHCTFTEIALERDLGLVLTHWRRTAEMPSWVGTYQISAVIGPAMAATLASGQSVVINDAMHDPLTKWQIEPYTANHARSTVLTPFIGQSTFLALLVVADEQPRAWREDEVSLLENVVARIWPLVVKARAEAALRASEAMARRHLDELEAIYKTAPVGLCVMDKELRYVRINERLAMMNGYPAAYHIGRTGRELFPDLAEKTEATLRRIFATGEAVIGVELTGELPTQPGVQRTWIESWLPLYNEMGEVVAINIVIEEVTEQKRAEAALRASAERLRLVTEAGGIGIFDHDLRTNQTEISEIYARITGFPVDAAVTREAWMDRIHPDDRSLVAAIWAQSQAAGASYTYECRLVRPDGVLVWIEVNAWVTQDELGRGVRITGAIRDITERKQAALHQQFLLDLNATLRKLSDPTTIQQTVVKRLGEYLGVSHCQFNAIDLAADRAILVAAWSASGSTTGCDVNPLSTSASAAYIADAQAGRTLIVHNTALDERPVNPQRLLLENQMLAMIRVPCLSEGQWVASLHVLQNTPREWRPDEVQLVESVVHHFWPLAEKARTEEALRASERRFRQLADTMPQVVWTSQADGTITYINQQWSTYSGMTLAETLDQGMWPALHPADLTANRAQWQHSLERGEPYEGEVRMRRQDGVYRWFLERALPVRDEANAVQQWFGVSMDITDRKAAEETLAAREAFLRALTDAVPNLIGYIDQQQRYRFVNATYEQWFARPRTAIEGHTLEEVFGEQAHLWRHLWQRALAGESVAFEETFTYPDGITRTVMGTYIPDRDAEGQVLGFYLYITDITARKVAEAAVAAYAAELRVITDNLLGFISYVDRAQCYRFVNAAYEELHGQPRDQIVGRSLHAMLGDAVYGQVQPYIERALQGETLQFEATLAYATGTRTIWATYVPDIDPHGVTQGFYALVTDISERKAFEEALRQSEETARQRLAELEAIYDTAPIGLCVLDRELRWLRINERLAEINGFPAADHIGRTVRELLPDLAPAAEPVLQEILTSNQPILNVELHGKTPAQPGVERIWREHWFPLHDQTGFVIGINVVAEEITERKRQEQQLKDLNATLEARVRERTAALEQANQELARSNRELEQFNYAAAHDLKSPLRGIQHLVHWISEDAAAVLSPASQKHLTLLQGRVQRLETLLDDMLAYSRIGRVRYTSEMVDTNLLVHNIIDLLAPPFGFIIAIPVSLPTLLTMRVPLETVFRNLLSNTIKHHHQPANGYVKVTANDFGAWIEFMISDNGPGIDPAFHERIFGMFQTLQPRDQVEGSGIGLALVKKTLESYGGQIRIESTPGTGTTFRFTWPK